MNRPPLRLTRPGRLPAPRADEDSLQVLTEAIDSLAGSARPAGSATQARPDERVIWRGSTRRCRGSHRYREVR